MYNGSGVSEKKKNEAIEDLKQAVSEFVVTTGKRLNEDDDYLKCIESFTKNLKKISSSRKPTYKRSLFSFSKEQAAPKGRKGKVGKLIPVQTTAKARRIYKHRGNSTAPGGRRHHDQKKENN